MLGSVSASGFTCTDCFCFQPESCKSEIMALELWSVYTEIDSEPANSNPDEFRSLVIREVQSTEVRMAAWDGQEHVARAFTYENRRYNLRATVLNDVERLKAYVAERVRRPSAPYVVEESTVEQVVRRVYGLRRELEGAGRVLVVEVAVNEADFWAEDALETVEFEGDEDRSSCAICLEDFEEGEAVEKSGCGHFFHEECIERWLARATPCPICRTQIRKLMATNQE
uniref:RING-type domain-containing protein n=1 Tax=Kalanchoe fedtschenkoi TaxID=63787 RepID=A0A7N0TXS5_KALFE